MAAEFGDSASINEIAINYDLGIQGFPQSTSKAMVYRFMTVGTDSDFAKILMINHLLENQFVGLQQLEMQLRILDSVKNAAYANDVRILQKQIQDFRDKHSKEAQKIQAAKLKEEEMKKKVKEKEDEVRRKELQAKAEVRRKDAESRMASKRK